MTTLWATIIVIGVLIFVHELGHYLAARSVGVRVERFSVGFPPRLFTFTSEDQGWLIQMYFFYRSAGGKWEWQAVWKKKISVSGKTGTGTEYCVALIPLGGYVKMAGIIDESMDTTITHSPDEFMSKSFLSQVFVMSAGVIMNVLLAFFIFSGLSYHFGSPVENPLPVVSKLVDEMPAKEAGILPGDKIISVNGEPVHNWNDMVLHIHSIPEKSIILRIERNGEYITKQFTTSFKLNQTQTGVDTIGFIGIAPEIQYVDVDLFQACVSGFNSTMAGFGIMVMSIKMLVTGEASLKELGGPIMIAQLAGETARAGIPSFLSFMALISINLAFINILPIPGLDGGHIFVSIIEVIIRKPLSVKTRMIFQQIGMALLLLLMITVLYNDIGRLFTN
ncbi:MAG: RIP metalloprotease RseP [Candidatus Neomarinimicrobiota bacterium]|nr:RIP metalloprotease RseP [Candidatus Neomarinimicrobiota bacterium]